jgi:hypothetical protein
MRRFMISAAHNFIRVTKSIKIGLVEHVARMGDRRSAYRVLVERPEGQTPVGRPGHRWEDNIKMDLQEVEWGDVDYIDMA